MPNAFPTNGDPGAERRMALNEDDVVNVGG
jgi:hypothetical protein